MDKACILLAIYILIIVSLVTKDFREERRKKRLEKLRVEIESLAEKIRDIELRGQND